MTGDACGSGCGFCGRCDDGDRPNATCSDCGVAFSRASADVGTLCDACCDARDAWVSALELRMAKAEIFKSEDFVNSSDRRAVA